METKEKQIIEFKIEDFLPQKKAIGLGIGLIVKNLVLNKAIKILLENLPILLPEFFFFIIKNSGINLNIAKEVVFNTLTKLEEETTI